MFPKKQQNNEHASRQAGFAAIGLSLVLGIVGSLLVSQSTSDTRNSVDLSRKQIIKGNLRDANEEALNLASHLLGNGVIGVTGTDASLKFTTNTQKLKTVREGSDGYNMENGRIKEDGSGINSEATKSGYEVSNNNIWGVNENGEIYINGCLIRRVGSSQFSNENITAASTAKKGNCPSGSDASYEMVTTVIKPSKTVPTMAIVTSQKTPVTHVQVQAESVSNDNKFNGKAVLRLPQASNQCSQIYREKSLTAHGYVENKDNLKACNVDHCPFMKPLTVNGAVQYKADGKPHLIPNPDYVDNISGVVDFKKLATVEKADEDDEHEPTPIDLYNFYRKAFAPAIRNPFNTIQRLGGVLNETATVEVNNYDPETGNAELEIKVQTSQNNLSATAGFDGWLVHKDGDMSKPGSAALPDWPEGVPYNDERFRKLLINGCRRSVDQNLSGDLVDFCARIRYPISEAEYQYTNQVRTCRAYGPDLNDSRIANLRSLIDGNSSDWTSKSDAIVIQELNYNPKSDFDASAITALNASMVNYTIVKDKAKNKTFFTDPEEAKHDELGPDGFSIVRVGFVYNGNSRVVNFHGADSGNMTVQLPIVYSGEEHYYRFTKLSPTTYKKEKIILKWEPTCTTRPDTPSERSWLGDLHFLHKQEVCFYITYHDVHDRLKCSREIAWKACRNGNGCFTGETKILMADGSEKQIKELRKNDLVRNPTTGKTMAVSMVFQGDEQKPLYRFHLEGQLEALTVTDNHPMVVDGGQVLRADQVKKNQKILGQNQQFLSIKRIETVTTDSFVTVWNLLLVNEDGSISKHFEDHFLLANGAVTGDWYIQNNRFPDNTYQDFSRFLSKNLTNLDGKR